MHRTMKRVLLAVVLAVAGAQPAYAQDFTFGWNPRSGDVWMDTWLGDMNRYGSRYRDPFIDEMVRYHGAPRDLVTDLLINRHWAPGDIYMACSIAAIIGRPCRYVVDVYARDHGQGWGNIAKRLGIKPGSPEFHRLKQGFVPVYDRWSRPIVLDAELQRVYPNHGKGGPKSASPGAGKGKDKDKASKSSEGSGKSGQSGGGKDKGAKNQDKAGKGQGKNNDKGKG